MQILSRKFFWNFVWCHVCINCGTESKQHGQDLVYEIQDLIEDTESEKDDENLDYPNHDTDEEENNEFSEDCDEFSEADTNIEA